MLHVGVCKTLVTSETDMRILESLVNGGGIVTTFISFMDLSFRWACRVRAYKQSAVCHFILRQQALQVQTNHTAAGLVLPWVSATV